ncbi:MAG: hypothetical protein R3261_14180, partial [Alphaproteobacteria bacterium]|nr:hypothetical protein [Alphaproteobacteria bacterium]
GFVSQVEIDVINSSTSLSTTDLGLPDEIDWITSRAGQVLGDIVAVAACDAGYFEKYGEYFVKSFDETQSLHLHIVGADKEDVIAFQERFPNYNISFSIEEDKSDIGSPYYAMCRFIRAKEIQKKLDRDIFLTDVDISEVIGLKQLLAFSSSSEGDICVFQGDTIVPWLRYPGAYMYLRNTAESAKYLSLLRLVCMDRLKNPKWFLDQSAINSVNHYIWVNMPELRLKTISSKDNFILNDIFISKFDLEEKKKIRKNADY